MATRSDNPNVPPPPVIPPATVPPAATNARTVAEGEQPFITAPVVYRRVRGGGGKKRRGRGRRKKAKYTRGTKQFQKMLLGVEEAARDIGRGEYRGLQLFVRRSKRSRRRRKDGLVRDLFRNAGRGFQRGFRSGADAPWDLARRIGTKPLWRTTRRFVLPLFAPFFGGR